MNENASELNWAQAAEQEINQKTKPQGSLGQLEALAIQLAYIQQTLTPSVYPARINVFAADHGIAMQGVSAYPPEVTAQMMANFAGGGAAINVLSRAADITVEVVDVGVNADLSQHDAIIHAKVRNGSRDFLTEPALTGTELDAAMRVGADAVERAVAAGMQTIGLGEMGIGNTTAAAAVLAGLCDCDPEKLTGRGTGIDNEQLAHKIDLIRAALKFHREHLQKPLNVLAAVGGLEIAAMTGAVLAGHRLRCNMVIDGFISTVAALAAVRHLPGCRAMLFFAHQSVEPGHQIALAELNAKPILNLQMRLGEGTGTALAIPILKSAAAILTEMATFASAGVSNKSV